LAVANQEIEAPATKPAKVNWSALAPGIAFVAIVSLALAAYAHQNAQAEKQTAGVKSQVKAMGLPEGYPLQDIPLYPGLKISESNRSDALSSDGKPMDEWEIHATSPDDRKKIFEFVKEKMMAREMSQQQYISIPTGYGVTYGDEKYSVEYEIEKQKNDKETRVVMRVYQLK
jgi:hypothetical protein